MVFVRLKGIKYGFLRKFKGIEAANAEIKRENAEIKRQNIELKRENAELKRAFTDFCNKIEVIDTIKAVNKKE